MNVYWHELKAYRTSSVIWIFSICGMAVVMMCFYPFIKADMETYLKLLDNIPPLMKAMMGIVIKNFLTPLGFYSFVFTYSSLLAAIQATQLGVGIVSKEERERTADFLMTKPISRINIVTAKLMAVVTIFLVTNLFYYIVTAVTLSGFSEGNLNWRILTLINLSLLILQLIFFSIGLAVSFTMKKVKSILPVSLGIVFVFFAISAFAVTSKEDKLRYLSPFQYFKPEDILQSGSYETGFSVVGTLIIVLGIAFSYVIYKRKSIPTV